MIRLHMAFMPAEALSTILGRMGFEPCSPRVRIRSPHRRHSACCGHRLAVFARTPDMDGTRLEHFTHNRSAGNSDRDATDKLGTLAEGFGTACSRTMVDCI